MVEAVKSRKDLRKGKRQQKKANRAHFQKRKKELRLEYKDRLKNNKTGNKQSKNEPSHRSKDADEEDMPVSDVDGQNFDNDEDIDSDFELSDEELEMKTNAMTNKRFVNKTCLNLTFK